MAGKPPNRTWTWIVLLILLVLSIPWYWPEDRIRPFIVGMPLWAFVSLVTSLLFAAVTAWVILRGWKDDKQPEEGE